MPPEPNLHRNNAAEWLMVAALWPVAVLVRLWDRLRSLLATDN